VETECCNAGSFFRQIGPFGQRVWNKGNDKFPKVAFKAISIIERESSFAMGVIKS
jgi:hypothetical protein